MKNLFESMSVALVLLLSLLIVVLIVQYNRVEEGTLEDVTASFVPAKAVVGKEKSTANYLNKLEGYSDVDVKVDPTEEDNANRVIVKSESTDNRIGLAVEDTYVKDLKNYKDNENFETIQPDEIKDVSEAPMPKEEATDEIGIEIDEALKDLE